MIFFLIAFGFIVLAFALFMKAAVQFAAIRSNERLALAVALAVQDQTAALRAVETWVAKAEAEIERQPAKVPATAGGIDDEWPEEIG